MAVELFVMLINYPLIFFGHLRPQRYKFSSGAIVINKTYK